MPQHQASHDQKGESEQLQDAPVPYAMDVFFDMMSEEDNQTV